jgi:hypothetical protein
MIVLLVLVLLVILPAALGFVTELSFFSRAMIVPFGVGTPVVYQHPEISTQPEADARDVRPAARGEFYYYSLVNYLRVVEVLEDGRVIAVSRDHTRLCFWPNDSQFRKARLRERFIYRWRFPHL